MEDGFINTTDSELKTIWKQKTQSKYSKNYIESVRQELLSRGLPIVDGKKISKPKADFDFNKLRSLIYFIGCSCLIIYCLLTGHVPNKTHTYSRDQDPFLFWLWIAGLAGVDILLLCMTLSIFLSWSFFDFVFGKPFNLLTGTPKKSSLKSTFSISEAKKFLSQKVVETARRDGVDFDNLEEKMLYWTAEHEDMDLQDKFDLKHNNDDYEKKAAGLLKSAYAYDRKNNPNDLPKYKDAYIALQQGDHYLTVLLDVARIG